MRKIQSSPIKESLNKQKNHKISYLIFLVLNPLKRLVNKIITFLSDTIFIIRVFLKRRPTTGTGGVMGHVLIGGGLFRYFLKIWNFF